jgi:hypothetical protein
MNETPMLYHPEAMPDQTAAPTPMDLIQMALQHGAAMDTIERLVTLHSSVMAQDAAVAYNAAMSRAQAAMGPVQADMVNPQTKSKYASYAALDRRVRPIYTKEGLALSFDTTDCPTPEYVRVLCYVSHSLGHSKTYQVDMPADGKGAKGGDVMTKTHAGGAAMSYGMRYLLKMIFNIAVGEEDTDGNHGKDLMPEGEFQSHLKAIRTSKTIKEAMDKYATAYAAAKAPADKKEIIKTYEEMKALLGGEK